MLEFDCMTQVGNAGYRGAPVISVKSVPAAAVIVSCLIQSVAIRTLALEGLASLCSLHVMH